MTMTIVLKRSWIAACLALAAALVVLPVLPAAAQDSAEAEATEETTTKIELKGQLIELSSTDLPTTIVVRVNPTGAFKDYTVEVPVGAEVKPAMSTWITGDSLKVEGTLNDNTLVVTAREVKDLSLSLSGREGVNGWVKAIDTAASTMTVTWKEKDTVLKVTGKTHLVVPPKNPAVLADFKVGDRVRARLVEGTATNEASIIVALRRGDDIFLKARTRPFTGTLKAIDESAKTLTVELAADKRLRADDVNNLVGVPGELVTVKVDEHTKFVRKYKGEASLDELTVGDTLFVVGRVDDDGTITARLIKDESIFKRGVARHLGKIKAIDTAKNELTVELALRKELKGSIHAQNEGVSRIDTSVTWKVTYTDDTKIKKNGKEATEADLKVGDIVRVEGVANATLHTVAASFIHATSADFHPLKRERPLKEIVKERIETAHGKRHAEDIVREQEPEDAEEEDADEDEDEDDDEDTDESDEDEDDDSEDEDED
ncbi:hypothetical protein EPO34_01325 [Patescibacteria group bacterium]|nr:MAG: hypothetical protein EPO34_01325 [Patescibacteria group bacterium]